MPSTRSGGGASPESGEEGGTAQLLEEAAAELSSEIAARKAAEERLAELEAQFADYSAEDRAFATPGPAGDPEEEEGEEEEEGVEFALLSHTVGHSIQFRVFWQCTPQTLTKPITIHIWHY